MKIKNLILLLGIMTLPAFSFAQSNPCRSQTPNPIEGSHGYTCQSSKNNVCSSFWDGTVDTRPSYSCGSNALYCHLCVCPGGTKRDGSKCASDTGACSNSLEVRINGVCQLCPGGQVPNKDKTWCEVMQTTTPTLTWLAVATSCGTILQESPCNAEAACAWTKDSSWFPRCTAKSNTTDQDKNKEDLEKAKKDCDAKKKDCHDRDDKKNKCVKTGIPLNTDVPFIWRCISLSNDDQIKAFPTLIWALMRILTSAMLIVGFMMILIAGVMMTTGGASPNNYKTGKEMIFKVWAALALLGSLGVILKLINPTFFT